MKRPSFQFYPADWRNDSALRMCSLGARGLWWEMLCIMHSCEPYGHLVAAGRSIEPDELGRIVGESAKDVRRWLDELDRHAIFSRTPAGVVYSRRMVRDEIERGKWRDRQGKSRAKSEIVTPVVTAQSQPSSSSPSSPSSKEESSLRDDSARPPKRASRRSLPEDFPGQADLGWATAHWLKKGRADLCEVIGEETEKFRDHHTGKNTTSANWPGSWRTWARNAMDFSRRSKNSNLTPFPTVTIHKVA